MAGSQTPRVTFDINKSLNSWFKKTLQILFHLWADSHQYFVNLHLKNVLRETKVE